MNTFSCCEHFLPAALGKLNNLSRLKWQDFYSENLITENVD